jgi:hypothetical protein
VDHASAVSGRGLWLPPVVHHLSGRCGALDAAAHHHRDETIQRLAKHVTAPAGRWRLNPAIS